jgi:hypothetical protein
VNISHLQQYKITYLATPYTKYPAGIVQAFRDACTVAARLVKGGVSVYSPIAHTHPIAIHGEIDPLDLSIWIPFDHAMLEVSDALVIAKMLTWEQSYGIKHEVEFFHKANKPVYHLDVHKMELLEENVS